MIQPREPSKIGPAYIAAFDPAAYLAECYAEIDAEHTFTIQFLLETFNQLPPGFLALELGGGPALYTVAALAGPAREIHFCDYVPANLAQVRRWLENRPDAFNWQPYIKMVLAQETGQLPQPSELARRAAQMRHKLTRLLRCDVLNPNPLAENSPQYELVFAPYCTDVAAATPPEWRQIMQNISRLVKPGGWLVIGVTTGSRINTLTDSQGRHHFSCVDLSAAEIRQGYLAAGYSPASLRLAQIAAPAGREYTGLAMAAARKPERTQP